MTVAANKGRAVPEHAFMMDTRFRIPRCIFTSAESDTTMALSTNIPMAIIMAASDMRCKAIPPASITIRVANMENTSPLPISKPFLKPMKKSRIATTVITETIRLMIKPWLAMADSCP